MKIKPSPSNIIGMNYGLAKQLKEAGFPYKRRPGDFILYEENGKLASINRWLRDGKENEKAAIEIIIPTLSELIEACGKTYINYLGQKCVFFLGFNEDWTAGFCDPETQSVPFLSSDGTTPEETVAKLWLAINSPSS